MRHQWVSSASRRRQLSAIVGGLSVSYEGHRSVISICVTFNFHPVILTQALEQLYAHYRMFHPLSAMYVVFGFSSRATS